MPRTFTFTECYAILNVDPKTFRNWLKKAGIDADKQVSKLDERVRYLDEYQVKKLAIDHGRDPDLTRAPTPEGSNLQGTGQSAGVSVGAHKLLKERVDLLEDRPRVDPVHFDTWQEQTARRIETLEEKYTTTLSQLTAALIALKELQDWKTSQETKPRPGRKPKASPAADTPEYQAGLAAVDQGED